LSFIFTKNAAETFQLYSTCKSKPESFDSQMHDFEISRQQSISNCLSEIEASVMEGGFTTA